MDKSRFWASNDIFQYFENEERGVFFPHIYITGGTIAPTPLHILKAFWTRHLNLKTCFIPYLDVNPKISAQNVQWVSALKIKFDPVGRTFKMICRGLYSFSIQRLILEIFGLKHLSSPLSWRSSWARCMTSQVGCAFKITRNKLTNNSWSKYEKSWCRCTSERTRTAGHENKNILSR